MKAFVSKHCAIVHVFFISVFSAVFSVGALASEDTYKIAYKAPPHTIWMESWAGERGYLPLLLLLFILMLAIFFVLHMKRKSLR